MIPLRTLELLQFPQVLQQVSSFCFTGKAAERCKGIQPVNSPNNMLSELRRVNELKILLAGGAYFPAIEHEDIESEIQVLALDGAMLEEKSLLALQRTATTANSMLRFLISKQDVYPYLFAKVSGLEVNEFPVSAIDAVLNEEGFVRDAASPDLSSLRYQIREKHKESDRLFNMALSKCRSLDVLREQEQGFFNGRRTLAVMSEHKAQVKGFVHSKSESGRTIFIEPASTVEINNDVAGLEADELREIRRILKSLCKGLKPHGGWLSKVYQLLQDLDMLQAKARYANSINANLPDINTNFNLRLLNARHPLLFWQNQRLNKATVPLNLELNENNRVMLVSGPNAGGKSIALKTAGLLQVMLQSGLLVPVQENSSMCFYDSILVDIGDTQSIENELSTYSARLKAMTSILEEANQASLVLMDEFGSGTDPELGSAVAEAVLESLVNSQCKAIITTHFGNVKLLAEDLQGAVNACMLFDLEKLEPKFILSVGKPGSSYTFEVAERVGFPKHLLERAKTRLSKEKVKLNKLLAEIQDQKTRLEEELHRKDHESFLLKMAKEKYLTLYKTWEEKQDSEQDYRTELKRLSYFGQKYLKLLEEWKDKKTRKEVIKRFIDGMTAELRKEETLRKSGEFERKAAKKVEQLKTKLRVGSRVRVMNGKEIGIVEEIRDDKAVLTFGALRLTAGLENLVLVEKS